MIHSFADDTTQHIAIGQRSRQARRIPESIWRVARRKLQMLEAATTLTDLKMPPANRLEALKGKRQGDYSIRVNDQYRITFRWEHHAAQHVKIEDYH